MVRLARWGLGGLFVETPASLRRLVLFLYAIVGPAFAIALALLGDPRRQPWPLVSVVALTAAGAAWLLARPSPKTGDWIFPVSIVPIACSGIAFGALGAWGHAFLGVLGAPLAGAAVLFEPVVVWTAYAVSVATCFGMLAVNLGAAAAAVNAALFAIVIALLVWVVQGKAQRFRALLRAMPDLIVRGDAEGRFLDIQQPPGELLPAPKDELLGRQVYEFAPPEVGEQMRAAVARALVTRAVQTVDYAVAYGGTPRHFEARIVRSGPREVLVIRRDVTERVRAEQALREGEARVRESQRQLALALEGSNDGFWDFDLRSRRFVFSPRCYEIIGEAPVEAMASGRYWWQRIHPDDVAIARGALETHLRGQTERIDVEYRLRDAGGGWRWVRALGMAVERDPAGRPLRLAGTLRDLTSRLEAQARLRAAHEENERLVGELRQALHSVKTLSGLLPVCAWCHNVRNDKGYWQKIEAYVAQRTDARFTHGLCPECYAKQFPGDSTPS